MKFKPYPKYKAHDDERFGHIPEHWRVVAVKHVSTVRYGIGEPPAYHTEGVPLLRATNVHAGKLYEKALVFVKPEEIPVNRIVWLQEGDIIVVRSGAYTGDSAIIPKGFGPCIAGFDMVLRCNKADSRFMQYALLSTYLKEGQIDLEKTRAAQPHLNAEELGSCLFIMPTCGEQASIASFLDRETVKIDTLIAKQEKLIELLKEKRQTVISHAVTKGLDSTVPMKCVEGSWIGCVPVHWNTLRIKWVAKMESGHTPDKKVEAYWTNCDIPWVSLNDTGYLKDHDYISDTAYQINELGIANSSARLLPEKVVVFSRDATIGRCAITTRPMAVSQHFIAWVCSDRILPEYLLHVLRSMQQELERLTFGATLKTIGMPDVKTLRTPLPSVEEQAAIVQHIRNETAKIDTLIKKCEQAIVLQKEHRTALISAAVTGKIDIREAASELQEAA